MQRSGPAGIRGSAHQGILWIFKSGAGGLWCFIQHYWGGLWSPVLRASVGSWAPCEAPTCWGKKGPPQLRLGPGSRWKGWCLWKGWWVIITASKKPTAKQLNPTKRSLFFVFKDFQFVFLCNSVCSLCMVALSRALFQVILVQEPGLSLQGTWEWDLQGNRVSLVLCE